MQLLSGGLPLHTRSFTVVVSRSDGDAWRATGKVLDLRKTGFAAMPTGFQPAGLIHDMTIELRVDPETRRIRSLHTEQPVVAVEPSERTCGESCRDPAKNLQSLAGEPLDGDFNKKLSLSFGGPRGCSHLLALFHLLSSSVRRALDFEAERLRSTTDRAPGEFVFQRNFFLDGCETEAGDIELAVQMGDHHLRPQSVCREATDRLECERNLRISALVKAPDQTLLRMRVADRERSSDTLAQTAWTQRPSWAADLTGAPVLGGFAARVMQSCGSDPAQSLLLDALLQLAPGHFQVLAALADQWLAASLGQPEEERAGMPSPDAMQANCYVWRPDGVLGSPRQGGRRTPGAD